MSSLAARIEMKTGNLRGRSFTYGSVILCFGTAEIASWRIPDQDIDAAASDPDAYTAAMISEKFSELFDGLSRIHRLEMGDD